MYSYLEYTKWEYLPTELKGNTVKSCASPQPYLLYLEFEWRNKLRFVRITKDQAAKFADVLSAIGGTMGLLTGFSIISGVEILYFAFRIIVEMFKKRKSVEE